MGVAAPAARSPPFRAGAQYPRAVSAAAAPRPAPGAIGGVVEAGLLLPIQPGMAPRSLTSLQIMASQRILSQAQNLPALLLLKEQPLKAF